MGNFLIPTLTFAIVSGQLIKIPIGTHGGMTLLDLVVILFCLLGIYNLKFKLKDYPTLIISGVIFILIASFSLLLTPLHLTQIQYLTSFFYTIRFALYLLLGWIIYSGGLPTVSKNIPHILTVSGIVLAVLGLLQFIFIPNLWFLESSGWDPHVLRAVSTFLDPNFFGAYMVLTLIMLYQKSAIANKWNILLFILVYIALLLTFSRSSYGMFTISFLTLSFLLKNIRLTILTLVLSLGLFIGFTSYQQTVAGPRNIDRVQSAKFRVDSWQQGLKLLSKYPILGIGHNAYRYALKEYNLAPEQFIQSRGASANDSSLLQVATTTGIIGLISFIFFLGFLMQYGQKKNTVLLAGIVGLIVHSFFANSLFYPFILVWLILMADTS